MSEPDIPSSAETGSIGIRHLKRYWAKAAAKQKGHLAMDALTEEWEIDIFLLSSLGLGVEQTLRQLYLHQQSFEEFEQWVLLVNEGHIDADKISCFNNALQQTDSQNDLSSGGEEVLTAADLAHWHINGYVIVRQAISKEDCLQTVAMICDFLQIKEEDPASWYNPHDAKEGIMVQLFKHPLIDRNRHAPRIRRAYEQLWQRKDIYVNTDKVGFNPPEKEGWKFPASRLHWDVSLVQPIPFGTQGILYLTDTAAIQGAFTVVPGFHLKIDEWLNNLPPGADPRTEDLYQLGPVPVEAKAGDLIIWHHALPHAASANRAATPRFVQYINYAPVSTNLRAEWK